MSGGQSRERDEKVGIIAERDKMVRSKKVEAVLKTEVKM